MGVKWKVKLTPNLCKCIVWRPSKLIIIPRIELNINSPNSYTSSQCKHSATLHPDICFIPKDSSICNNNTTLTSDISVPLVHYGISDIISNLPMSVQKKLFLPKYTYKYTLKT